ncbi:L-lactate dehydrogenase [alpha proteobacterium U9-1i]|nr:L-lactate dehydrogenase [alpha proteobacterium U9-1i]
MVFDYIDGGADDEVTLARSIAAFQDIELAWDALVDVAAIDTATSIMGQAMHLPFFISPTAASRLFHPRGGEIAVARAAERAGIVYATSSIASTTMEDIAAATGGPRWFQVYVWKDRGLVAETLERAKAAGFTGVVLTVDVPVAGNRERDPANRFTIPPEVNWRTATQTLARPSYLWDVLTTPPIGPANFMHLAVEGGVIELINQQFDRAVTWRDAEWLRQIWGGKFAVKGISTPADARRCVEIGANAVWVSNHGGRQLDTAPATIDTLPAIADAVRGDAEIILDGGVRRGSDIVKALALGANAVAIGRAYLWGLAAGGEAGVSRALEILETELRRTMALLGRPRIADLNRDIVFRRA